MSIKETKMRTNIIIDREFKAELEEYARQDNRSLNNFIITVLRDYAENRRKNKKCGGLPPQP